MHNPSAFCRWKTPLSRFCRGSMDGFAADYTYYIRELPQSKPVGFASSLWEGANPLRLTPFTSSPEGGALFTPTERTIKAPQKMTDFPRSGQILPAPGRNVTVGDKKGESGIVQR